MIVLDASVLIAHLDKADAHHERAGMLLEASVAEQFGASPMTLAAALVTPARAGVLAQANAALHDLGVRAIALTEDAPVRLAQLRAETKLTLPDCCVLLAAEQEFALLATFDDRLGQSARLRGIKVLGDS